MSDNQPELQGLMAVGFTKYEAMAYRILLQDYPATAYEISKRGALTKANVYGALESLAQKGAVQPVSEDPVKYAPVDPERFFREISRRTTSLCRELAASLAGSRRQKLKEYVWTLSGEESIDKKIIEMMRQAGKQIWLKGPHHLVSRYAESLRDAARRRIEILIILFGNVRSAKRFSFGLSSKVYLHEGSGEMLAIGKEQFVIATDFAEMLIANFGEHCEGAYTRSDGLVFMAETMIRHEVYLAEIMNEFGPAVEKRFGKALISLRSRYLPPNLARKVKKQLSSRRSPQQDKSGRLNTMQGRRCFSLRGLNRI